MCTEVDGLACEHMMHVYDNATSISNASHDSNRQNINTRQANTIWQKNLCSSEKNQIYFIRQRLRQQSNLGRSKIPKKTCKSTICTSANQTSRKIAVSNMYPMISILNQPSEMTSEMPHFFRQRSLARPLLTRILGALTTVPIFWASDRNWFLKRGINR